MTISHLIGTEISDKLIKSVNMYSAIETKNKMYKTMHFENILQHPLKPNLIIYGKTRKYEVDSTMNRTGASTQHDGAKYIDSFKYVRWSLDCLLFLFKAFVYDQNW